MAGLDPLLSDAGLFQLQDFDLRRAQLARVEQRANMAQLFAARIRALIVGSSWMPRALACASSNRVSPLISVPIGVMIPPGFVMAMPSGRVPWPTVSTMRSTPPGDQASIDCRTF